MRLSLPVASKSYTCNQCTEVIPKLQQYVNIRLGTDRDYLSHRQLQTAFYMTIRLHIDCFPKWVRTRPRRNFKPRGGRRPHLIFKEMVRTPTGSYAFEMVETPINPEQKKRRAVLVASFHRYKYERDLSPILEELEQLGGIPKKWLS